MLLNITFDSSVNSAPAAFKTTINAVAQYLQAQFTDPITINLRVGYGEVGGQALDSGALGESESFFRSFSYSQIRNAFAVDATSADDASAVASLPASDPTGGGAYWVTTAEAKALGLLGATSSIDGAVGFSKTAPLDYDSSNGIASGQYDLFGIAAHEITEVMGRSLLVGQTVGSTHNSYMPMDLFHYSAPGVRDFSGTVPGYFSLDGGDTSLDAFNTNPNGDFGDWAASAGHDFFLAFSNSGVINVVTAADLRVMDVIGYDLAHQGSTTPPPALTPASTSESPFVWSNDNGDIFLWQLTGDGSQYLGADLGTYPTSWHVAGTADFDGDGRSDILLRNDDGDAYIWELTGNGGQYNGVDLGIVTNDWHIQGTGDFNGDGKSDILWRNNDGDAYIWEMTGNGGQYAGVDLGIVTNDWHIQGTGDFNGDGKSDILWRNDNGDAYIWEMTGNGGQYAGVDLGIVTNDWHIRGTGDFNGDGKSDILWRNDNGDAYLWEMTGNGSAYGGIDLGVYSNSWHIQGTGDFNGDGKSDILWRNDNGDVYLWEMTGNGGQYNGVDFGIIANSWHLS